MRPNVQKLADGEYDLLVVGAGIYGAALACRASMAGLRVALIDKGDFGDGASANSLKILHGGLRYLQQLNFSRMRESIRARRDGLTSLPHLVHPAPFLAPSGSSLKRSRAAFQAAALINDAVSFDRNEGVPKSHAIPPARVLSKPDVRRILPDADIPGDRAMLWHDGFIENTERYTLAYVMTAEIHGATVANYVRAVSLTQSGNTVTGASVRDEIDGGEFKIRAKFTVNTSGPWIADLVPRGSNIDAPAAWTRAWNIVAKRNWFGEYGVGLDNKERNFFFAPWRGGTVIGTAYDVFRDHADACHMTMDDIEAFVADVNQLYPKAELKREDVSYAHVGVMPAKRNKLGHAIPEPSGETRIIDFGIDGFLALLGVKYTTGAFWAEKLTDILRRKLDRKDAHRTGALYGSEEAVQEEGGNWLTRTYGARAGEITAIADEKPEWKETIPGTEAPLAAVVHAVRNEHAVHLDDAVIRRTGIGSFERPDFQSLEKCADAMADQLGWSADVRAKELERIDRHYRRLGLP